MRQIKDLLAEASLY